jgi:hypothetical protein
MPRRTKAQRESIPCRFSPSGMSGLTINKIGVKTVKFDLFLKFAVSVFLLTKDSISKPIPNSDLGSLWENFRLP